MGLAETSVAIYAQLSPGAAGGVAHAVEQLVTSLGGLEGNEIYVIVTSRAGAEWLAPLVSRANQRLVIADEHLSHTGPAWERRAAAIINRRAPQLMPTVLRLWQRSALALRSRFGNVGQPPISDGFIESLGVRLIHFPYQRFIRTRLPTIFEPWDLQHRHLPQFFSATERRLRDGLYQLASEQASCVVTATDAVRADLIDEYRLDPAKILVIPRSPTPLPLVSDARSEEIAARLRLPEKFVVYPAQTWPHKNHKRLLEAMSIIEKRYQLDIHAVCTGALNDHFKTISGLMVELGLADRVSFTGYVSRTELAVIFRRATCLVFPSLFEGNGFPILEAMAAGVPVCCSGIPTLLEVAGSAARYFDPESAEDIAQAIADLWSNPASRERLTQRASSELVRFDASRSARMFRAVYRALTGSTLSEEDRALLTDAQKGGSGVSVRRDDREIAC